MKVPFQQVCDALANSKARRVTKYLSPSLTVKATRLHRADGRVGFGTFLVTAGRPNYREREFIAKRVKAKKPFPVRKLQVQQFPKVKRA